MKPWERFTQGTQEPSGPWSKFEKKREDLPQLTPNTDRKYSPLEKAVYTGRAGAEGLLFGLGDVLAGATNTVMSPLAKTVNALKEGTPLSVQDFNPVKNFKEGRWDFVREQEDFKKEHPGLNTTGEVLGGLVTGIGGAGKVAGAKALGKLGKWGTAAATGAGSGALWGFGNGLTRGDQELSLTQGAKEALPGAFLGGAFGIAAPAALGAAGKAANLINRNNRAKEYRHPNATFKHWEQQSSQTGQDGQAQ